jgi:protein-L-isoaspartate(D-aspartate) O-methyltransferase
MEVITADHAPSGKHYVRFHNTEAGRGAQALQAFAVDGRYVHELDISVSVSYRDIHPGPTPLQLPQLGIVFYDENRATIGEKMLGPWRGNSDWTKVAKKIEVPLRAREAIVRIGLCGATGELLLDDVQLTGLPWRTDGRIE